MASGLPQLDRAPKTSSQMQAWPTGADLAPDALYKQIRSAAEVA
jgi:hypothetical protein